MISRVKTLYFVAVLCLVQLVWTLHQVRPTPAQWFLVATNLTVASAGFVMLYRLGKRYEGNREGSSRRPGSTALVP
ncbi:MAG: hypothetical protein KC416_13230 [Myxococcales bacterium]|nr:hypothetical protein [Myxococcales bacterium]